MRGCDSGAKVMTAGIEHGEIKIYMRMSDPRSNADAPCSQPQFSGFQSLNVLQVRAIGVDGRGVAVAFEKRADSEMRGHPGQVKHARPDKLIVNRAAIAKLRNVAPHRLKPQQKLFFQV